MFPSSALRVLAIAQLIRAPFLRRSYVTVTNGDKSGVSLPESAKKAAAQQSAHLTQMTKPELYVPAGASGPRAAQLEGLRGGKGSGDSSQTGTDGLSGEQRCHSDGRKQVCVYLLLGLKHGGVQLTGKAV